MTFDPRDYYGFQFLGMDLSSLFVCLSSSSFRMSSLVPSAVGAVGTFFMVSRSASPGRYNSNIFVERSRNLDVSWRGWHIFVVGWSASPGRNNSNIFVEHSRNLDVGRRGRRLQVGTTLTFL